MGSGVYGVFGSDGVYGVYGLPWDVNPFGEKGSRPGASALSRPKVENPAAVSLQVFTAVANVEQRRPEQGAALRLLWPEQGRDNVKWRLAVNFAGVLMQV